MVGTLDGFPFCGKTRKRILNPLESQTNSALETRRVPQVSLLRPGILLGEANRVHPRGQEKAFLRSLLHEAGKRHTPIREQASPRSIQVKPALRAKPAGWQLRNMQQSMATRANQLRAIPSQKISRSFSNPGGVGEHPKAYRAPLSLILKYPSKGEEKPEVRQSELDKLRACRTKRRNSIGNIHRAQTHQRHHERNLTHQKHPASSADRPGKAAAKPRVLAKWQSCRGRQRDHGHNQCEQKDGER